MKVINFDDENCKFIQRFEWDSLYEWYSWLENQITLDFISISSEKKMVFDVYSKKYC